MTLLFFLSLLLWQWHQWTIDFSLLYSVTTVTIVALLMKCHWRDKSEVWWLVSVYCIYIYSYIYILLSSVLIITVLMISVVTTFGQTAVESSEAQIEITDCASAQIASALMIRKWRVVLDSMDSMVSMDSMDSISWKVLSATTFPEWTHPA